MKSMEKEPQYAQFTPEMRKTHTILVPDMLPIHFRLIIAIMKRYGYNMELLTSSTRTVVDEGLKNVHNDTCYPALLVIGQFLEAIKSGKYDTSKLALMISQTGGGCRASNYIHLLRKALAAEYPDIPVISLNFTGTEKSAGFRITAGMLFKLLNAVLYGDLLMSLYNQVRPYELHAGDADKVLAAEEKRLADLVGKHGFSRRTHNYKRIIAAFDGVERSRESKPRVGIVGEIYVKYSPLANNHLEDFLVREGCEPVVPGLMDFVLYSVANVMNDRKLYGDKSLFCRLARPLYGVLRRLTNKMSRCINRQGSFRGLEDFEELRAEADKLIHQGVKMGEGWLITAEMGCLAKTGTENIVCTQPFGCLPNHIVAKGMTRKVKEAYPQANIVAIDYDPGATTVNQENRLKLMLANIREK